MFTYYKIIDSVHIEEETIYGLSNKNKIDLNGYSWSKSIKCPFTKNKGGFIKKQNNITNVVLLI